MNFDIKYTLHFLTTFPLQGLQAWSQQWLPFPYGAAMFSLPKLIPLGVSNTGFI
jgi:hypothetical protein